MWSQLVHSFYTRNKPTKTSGESCVLKIANRTENREFIKKKLRILPKLNVKKELGDRKKLCWVFTLISLFHVHKEVAAILKLLQAEAFQLSHQTNATHTLLLFHSSNHENSDYSHDYHLFPATHTVTRSSNVQVQ